MLRQKRIKVSLLLLISLLFIPHLVLGVNSGLPESNTTEEVDDSVQMNLWVESEVSGVIDGSVTDAGREGSMQVLGYHHQISAPPDGSNIHNPFRIVKNVDEASPLLMQALCNRENLVSVTLKFYRYDDVLGFYEYYRIVLEDARIIQIESHALPSGGFTETLSFDYEKITWTWIDGNIEYSDGISRV